MASREPVQRSLTIGVDARAATEVPAGRGRVVRELLLALAAREDPHTYRCYARTLWGQQLDERFTWKLIAARDPIWHARAAAAASRECDVFLSSNSYLTVSLLRIPAVAIVYDMIAFEPRMRPNRRSVVIERLTLSGAVHSARGLICISQSTRAALVARFPAASSKAVIAPLGVSSSLLEPEIGAAEGLPTPGFVLAVGTLEPRKNLPRLVEAYAALPARLRTAHQLVVVGPLGWQTGPIRAALDSLGDGCVALGHVSDARLAELYRRCALFCYPSLGEGFGLPVLEAMAAGAAVVTSRTSSLPEVGGDAVEYLDPESVSDITTAIERVLGSSELRASLSTRARARAREFTWARTAEITLAALQASLS